MNFLLLEPFFGGSHGDFAQGLVNHSRHNIELISMPDRFWKWRMRGASLYFAKKVQIPMRYDGLILSSLMSLADLKALWMDRCPPALVYFHENQLTYPAAPGERADHQPGFTNITTALTARRVLFNSRTHLDAFTAALPDFIRIMPDFRPQWVVEAIKQKTGVAFPGCHFPPALSLAPWDPAQPPLIIWNHRWEHDKNPEAFFKALGAMISRGIDFQVALLGEDYTQMPEVFQSARQQLGRRLVQYGHEPSRRKYYYWLSKGTVVISTALQENFGIAVIEAMRHGCLPLLPKRLSYPEILPEAFHNDFLYNNQDELEEKLTQFLISRNDYKKQRADLAAVMAKYAWENVIEQYDEELIRLVKP